MRKPLFEQEEMDRPEWVRLVFISAYLEEDSYEEGADPYTRETWFFEKGRTVASPEKFIAEVLGAWDLPQDKDAWGAFDGEGGRIDVQEIRTVNSRDEYVVPNESEITEWKRGERQMWIVDYTLMIRFGRKEGRGTYEWEPTAEEISEVLGIKIH